MGPSSHIDIHQIYTNLSPLLSSFFGHPQTRSTYFPEWSFSLHIVSCGWLGVPFFLYPAVEKTDMRKPLFKAPDGGRFEILWEKEDLTQSELQRGQERPCFSMRRFAPKPFPDRESYRHSRDVAQRLHRPAYPCPCGQIFMQYLGLRQASCV